MTSSRVTRIMLVPSWGAVVTTIANHPDANFDGALITPCVCVCVCVSEHNII
jgi:pyruvoyl-dependent arginine decarboxylase (PvlArgDC)